MKLKLNLLTSFVMCVCGCGSRNPCKNLNCIRNYVQSNSDKMNCLGQTKFANYSQDQL